ncbi:hypothetical protein SAMN05421858_5083 [Haladaptatus litoreus]|uniref:Uncharacterized protein n=1 Tax=Haladaptatus litoreus TaxID=553468 RepID=A0A1N7FHR7_9EURY|nr:hypothetical protein [Haladaptatus litoreus]SIR99968.1 hypothetical protein SAMN05421858_5083 [Haladaptatus litoreus]
MSEQSVEHTKQCQKCGETEWGKDPRFDNYACDGCGWMPREIRQQELIEVLGE